MDKSRVYVKVEIPKIKLVIPQRYVERLISLSRLIQVTPEVAAKLCFYYGLGHLESLASNSGEFQHQIEKITMNFVELENGSLPEKDNK